MSRSIFRFFVLPFGATLLLAAEALASDALTTVKNPAGGQIVFGPLSGQLTPQAAMGEILHRVRVYCGDRPHLGRLVQNHDGDVLAAFFTVTGKNQDGRPMAGLVIVSAPKTDTARSAVLSDYADHFPSTANSLFALLKQKMNGAQTSSNTQGAPSGGPSAPTTTPGARPQSGGAAAATAPAAPPQPLVPARFPDGTGVIGLPAGWTMIRAQLGDVSAKGARGEALRFGMAVPVIDPNNAQSRALMGRGGAPGNFVAVPFGTEPASAFKSAITQLSQKARKQPPVVNIGKIQEIPLPGGKNYFLFGDIDVNDGQGAQSLVLQMISTPPQQMGTWQMTWFQVMAPQQVMAEERSTIAAIFPSYSRDSNRVNTIINDQIRVGIEQANQFVAGVQQHIDNSNQFTAGFSDFLRGQTVIVDTETGGHARTSDELSDMLIQENPNRFEVVPTGEYIKGIDY